MQDNCPRPHDAAACKRAYAGDGLFRAKLAHFMEVAEANGNKVPSKEQLRDAGVLPKWSHPNGNRWMQERNAHSNRHLLQAEWLSATKGTGGRGLGGWTQGRGEGSANTSGGGRPLPGKVKFDPARAVVVFAPQGQSHQMAALEPEDVPTEGARYESSAADNVQASEGETIDLDCREESMGERLARAMPLLQEAVMAGERGLPHRILQAAVNAQQAGVSIQGFPEAIINVVLAAEGADAERLPSDDGSQEGSDAESESSVSSSSSDDGMLPVYLCALCINTIGLGGGGTLWCSTC